MLYLVYPKIWRRGGQRRRPNGRLKHGRLKNGRARLASASRACCEWRCGRCGLRRPGLEMRQMGRRWRVSTQPYVSTQLPCTHVRLLMPALRALSSQCCVRLS